MALLTPQFNAYKNTFLDHKHIFYITGFRKKMVCYKMITKQVIVKQL